MIATSDQFYRLFRLYTSDIGNRDLNAIRGAGYVVQQIFTVNGLGGDETWALLRQEHTLPTIARLTEELNQSQAKLNAFTRELTDANTREKHLQNRYDLAIAALAEFRIKLAEAEVDLAACRGDDDET